MQRNAAQEALRVGREQLEQVLDALPDRIFRFDHNLHVQHMNQPAARGLPLIELGMHVDEFAVHAVCLERRGRVPLRIGRRRHAGQPLLPGDGGARAGRRHRAADHHPVADDADRAGHPCHVAARDPRAGVLPPQPGELVHSNGSRVPVLLASAVVERTATESVTFAVDETATHGTVNELRNQTLLPDSAGDAIVLRDLEGRVCFWNEGARRLYG